MPATGGQLYNDGQKMPNMSTVARLMAFTVKKIMNITYSMFIKIGSNTP